MTPKKNKPTAKRPSRAKKQNGKKELAKAQTLTPTFTLRGLLGR